MNNDKKKKVQNKKLVSLGLLLSVTTFIAAGSAMYHIVVPSNNSNAEVAHVEKRNRPSSDSSEAFSLMEDTSSTQKNEERKEENVVVEESTEQEDNQPVVEERAEKEVDMALVTENVAVQETQVVSEEVPRQVDNSPQKQSPMTINILGQTIGYQNGGMAAGQSIIDSDPYGAVSTWGGMGVQSGTDGLNTHFIGHNPGAFALLFSLTSGDTITITDCAGTGTRYQVRTILTVDDYGMKVGTGKDYYEFISGSGGGERVTFQTCIDEATNLIIVAYP